MPENWQAGGVFWLVRRLTAKDAKGSPRKCGNEWDHDDTADTTKYKKEMEPPMGADDLIYWRSSASIGGSPFLYFSVVSFVPSWLTLLLLSHLWPQASDLS